MLVILPTWVNLLLKAYAFMGIFGQQGGINAFLGFFGIAPIDVYKRQGLYYGNLECHP